MKQLETVPVRYVIIGLGVLGVGLMVHQGYRWYRINKKREAVEQADRDLRDLYYLGFSDDDEALALTKNFCAQCSDVLQKAQSNWYDYNRKSASSKVACNQRLDNLIELHKKMIASDKRDLQDYERLQVPNNSAIVKFSKKHLQHMQKNLERLEKHASLLTNLNSETVQRHLHGVRSSCIKGVNQCKRELRAYKDAGITPSNRRVKLAKTHLTERLRALYEVEGLLGR